MEAGDQLAVEAANIAGAITVAPTILFESLDRKTCLRLQDWLLQVNEIELQKGNWQTFPIVVNASLAFLGLRYSRNAIVRSMRTVQQHLGDDGWFRDGPSGRIDYYSAFSTYTNLVLARHLLARTGDESLIRLEGLDKFLRSYASLFDRHGSAVPYGRSLTYRWANLSPWAMTAHCKANVDEVNSTAAKAIYRDGMGYWIDSEPLKDGGFLRPGYRYPSDGVAEYYISYASSYWSCRSFVALSRASDDPFWSQTGPATCPEQRTPVPLANPIRTQALGGLIDSDDSRSEVVLITTGQDCDRDFGGSSDKYSKFAYSSRFGFSISRSTSSLSGGAFDSTLAVRDAESQDWKSRRQVSCRWSGSSWVAARWEPMSGVQITTLIATRFPWHVRWHHIRSNRFLTLADGGYAFQAEGDFTSRASGNTNAQPTAVHGPSAVFSLEGWSAADIIDAMPRTNIMWPLTRIPTLIGCTTAGETMFGTLVTGRYCGTHYGSEEATSWSRSFRDFALGELGAHEL